MKKLCKVIVIIFITVSLYSNVYNVNAEDIWSQANRFLHDGLTSGEGWQDILKGDQGKDDMEKLLGLLWGLGLLAIFVTTVILGIKYMLVDPNERSKIKQATWPYIIGVVIIFGAITIWKFIIQLLEGGI